MRGNEQKPHSSKNDSLPTQKKPKSEPSEATIFAPLSPDETSDTTVAYDSAAADTSEVTQHLAPPADEADSSNATVAYDGPDLASVADETDSSDATVAYDGPDLASVADETDSSDATVAYDSAADTSEVTQHLAPATNENSATHVLPSANKSASSLSSPSQHKTVSAVPLSARKQAGGTKPVIEPATGKSASTQSPTMPKQPQPSQGDSKANIGVYQILQELGAGGMGKVYKAYHPQLERTVAIKVMLRGDKGNERERERFLTEARLTAKLKHPNIVAVHDVVQEQGQDYIVMDFIAGESLLSQIKRARPAPRRALEIMREIALAMDYAHSQHVVHRDLKPGNVMMEKGSGRVLILDFGLAKNVQLNKEMTRAGEILGTPKYMAPEQARGEAAKISPRTDIYAMGAMLYEMVTGVSAAIGDTPFNIIYNILQKDVVPPRKHTPNLARDIETICLKAMEKDPARRYQSGKTMAEDIERFFNGEVILARPTSLWYRAWKKAWRHKPALATFLMVLLLFFGWGVYWQKRQVEQTLAAAASLLQKPDSESTLGDYQKMAMQLELLAAKGQANEKLYSQLVAVNRRLSKLSVPKGDFGTALSALESCSRFANDKELQEWREDLDKGIWGEIDNNIAACQKNKLEGQNQSKGIKPAPSQADIEYLRQKATENYQNAIKQAQEAEKLLFSLERYLAVLPQKGQIPAYLKKVKVRQDKVRQDICELYKEIGNHALAGENYLLARLAFAQAGEELSVAESRIQQAEAAVREQTLQQLKKSMLLLSKPPEQGALQEYVAQITRFYHADVVKELIRYVDTQKFEEQALNLWQRLAAIQALGRFGDTQTREGTHNSVTCLIRRLENCDITRGLQEVEVAIWALYRLRAGIVEAHAKELVYQVRQQVRSSRDNQQFLDNTSFAYRGLPLPQPSDEEQKKWDARKWHLRGQLYHEQRDFEEAIACYNRALTKDGKFVESYLGRAQVLMEQGNVALAVHDYSGAIALKPNFPAAHHALGLAHLQLGEPEQAVQNFTQAVRLDPAFAEGYHQRGNAHLLSGNIEKSLADYDQAIQIAPRFADCYFSRGQALERKNDWEGAVVAYTEALRASPKALFYCARASVKRHRGDMASAVEDYNSAIRWEPNYSQAYSDRAMAYADKQDTRQALLDIHEAIYLLEQETPAEKKVAAEAYYRLGLIYAKATDYEKAVKSYTQALALSPELPLVYFGRALAREKLQDMENAIRDYSEAIRLDDKMARAYKNRGFLYAAQQKVQDAIADFTRSLALDPKDTEARKMELYMRKNKK
jgi:tetratricopeptide (TPR) repeat protein/predicted Ser/Thr protein kinase